MPVINYGTPAGGGFQLDTPGGAGYGLGGIGTGYGPGMDLSWIGDFAKRQAQNKLAMSNLQLKQAQEAGRGVNPSGLPPRPMSMPDPNSPYGANSAYAQGMRMRSAAAQLPEQTAAQRYVTGTGGMTGQAYSDMARQMMGQNLAGIPTTDYTGMTELAKAMGGSSAAAVGQAGENWRQQQQYGQQQQNPSIASYARGFGVRG